MVPTAVLLVDRPAPTTHDGIVDAVQASVAGLVAMVPEGLVLLTSIAFAVGATRLGPQAGADPGAGRHRGPGPGRRRSASTRPAPSPRARSTLGTVEHLGDGRRRRRRAARARRHGRRRRAPQPEPRRPSRAELRPPTGLDPHRGRARSPRPASGARRPSTDHGSVVPRRARHPARPRAGDTAEVDDAAERLQHYAERAAGCCCWPGRPSGLARRDAPRRARAGGAGRARRAGPRVGPRHHRLLRRAGRRRQGHLGRQPGHGRRGGPAGRRARRRRPHRRPRPCPTTRRPAGRRPRDALGVRSGHAAAEAGDGARPPVAGPRSP